LPEDADEAEKLAQEMNSSDEDFPINNEEDEEEDEDEDEILQMGTEKERGGKYNYLINMIIQ
jgi:hypothetical protein